MSSGTQAAIGFRTHTGWAAAVAVSGPASSPKVIDRRRVVLAGSDNELPAAVYHAVQKLPLSAAEKLVKQVTESAHRMARAAIRTMITDLRAKGYELVASGIVLGGGRLPSSLEAILRSHPLVHTAEGELYRQALIAASETCNLRICGISGRELYEKVASALGIDPERLRAQLGEAGKAAGKPWAQDQKEALAVALSALAAATASGGPKRSR